MSSQAPTSDVDGLDFVPQKPERAFEHIVNQIRAAVASGKLKTGDRLPSVREMQAQFEVGTATVLAALRALEELRLVEVKRGATGGAFIRPMDSSPITRHLLLMTDTQSVSIDELVAFRTMLEGQNAAWAASAAEAADLARLEQIADDVERFLQDESTPWDVFLTRDAAFHVAVARAAKNRVSFAVMDGLIGSLNQLLFTVPPGHGERLLADFRGVHRAVRAGRAKQAQRIMEEHIEFFTSILQPVK